MNYYKISLIDRPDPRWIEAASKSKAMPATVESLLDGQQECLVTDIQLDAICEWERGVCRISNTSPQIDFWPTHDLAN